MEQEDNFKKLVDSAEIYFDSEKKLIKLEVVEKVSIATSSIATTLIVFSVFMIMFLFMSLTMAYFIAEYTGRIYIGFSVVWLMFLFIGIVLYIKRNSWLKVKIENSIINKVFNHE